MSSPRTADRAGQAGAGAGAGGERTDGGDGVRVVTELTTKNGRRVEIVRRVKVTKRYLRMNDAIRARRKWPKFGVAADAGAGTTTYVSHDPIYMADPNQREEEEDMSQKLMRIREQAATRRRVIDKVEGELGLAGAPEAAAAASSGPDGVEPRPTSLADKFANRGPGGAYVPPGRRGIAEGRVEEQTTTLRITPLSSTVTEMALRELCGEFGRCNVRLPRRYNGEAHDFAFVTFSHREDAERARNKLNGHRYEYTVLEVDWAKPSTRNRDGLAGQRVSGYGKALPQTARR